MCIHFDTLNKSLFDYFRYKGIFSEWKQKEEA